MEFRQADISTCHAPKIVRSPFPLRRAGAPPAATRRLTSGKAPRSLTRRRDGDRERSRVHHLLPRRHCCIISSGALVAPQRGPGAMRMALDTVRLIHASSSYVRNVYVKHLGANSIESRNLVCCRPCLPFKACGSTIHGSGKAVRWAQFSTRQQHVTELR